MFVADIDDGWRKKVMIANWVSYILMLTLSFTAQGFSKNSLSEISAEWRSYVSPAGWAFSIWGIIYLLEACLLVYLSLPKDKVPNRSDQLIFNDINMIWAANLLATAAWLPIFMTNTKGGFIIAQILIVFQLYTLLKILAIVDKAKLNITEFILMRVTFSIYAGWVTAATTVGFTIIFKTWGLTDPETKNIRAWDFLSFLMFMSEEAWDIVFMCAVLVFYNVVAWRNQNPIYGCLFLWAFGAILTQLNKERPDASASITTVTVLMILQGCSMAGLIGFIYKKYRNNEYSSLTE